mmetsp:Transcript_32439/g.39262  ORF Transcript_32439/g.39262 Transcript_32439/m.39262 type:complete len:285 (+) Transcript_32439:180-1034(+)|eukprot:CAMPEP_0197851102 /NCGR_PEP_ID=MMETSP1438-20131217/17262_1 /TAXON_ID=1461541 /ORGANISM="Pterosperma sp., Strain CCMP1384" /LENGTH=284 /DNA_ID=CAMNT_0043464583 /DNA_START=180 /DNA_END=1034 /DNA_ORIENTATION=-
MAENTLFGLAGYGSGSEAGTEGDEEEGGVLGLVGYSAGMSPVVVDEPTDTDARDGSPIVAEPTVMDTESQPGAATVGPSMPGGPSVTVEVDPEVEEIVSIPMSKSLFPTVEIPEAPSGKCEQELQDKIVKYLQLKAQGRSLNSELRSLKSYRNPDFLQQCVDRWNIKQHNSHLSPEIFDPENLPKEDYYDQIAKEVEKIQEAKNKANAAKAANRTQIEFTPGTQAKATTGAAAMVNRPTGIPGLPAGVPNVAATVSAFQAAALLKARQATTKTDGQERKRKWDH